MARASLGRWMIGGVLLLLAGCAPSDWFLFGSANSNGERVIAGRLDVVAASTKAHLEKLGVNVKQTQSEGSIWLQGTTGTGARFTMVLLREQTAQGDQTRVRIEWIGTRDEDAHVQIMARFEAQTR